MWEDSAQGYEKKILEWKKVVLFASTHGKTGGSLKRRAKNGLYQG
jgi:hypothetical protein